MLNSPASDRLQNDVLASLVNPNDVDYYRVTAAAAQAGTQNTLVVSVWSMSPWQQAPTVAILDAQGNAVNAQIVESGTTFITLQVPNVVPGQTYYIQASAPSQWGPTTSYQMITQFRPDALQVIPLESGTLTNANPVAVSTLQVPMTELFHFQLTATSPNNQLAGVAMVVTDAQNRVIAAVVAWNSSSGIDVWLRPGTYTITFLAFRVGRTTNAVVNFTLTGVVRTDPIGITPTDPTSSGVSASPTPTDSSGDPTSTDTGTDSNSTGSTTTNSNAPPPATDPSTTPTTDDQSTFTYTVLDSMLSSR